MIKTPLLYATIPFALGIVAQRESPMVSLVVLVVVIVAIYAFRIAHKIPILSFLVLGFAISAMSQFHNAIAYNSPVEVIIRIDKTPTISGRWYRTQGEVVAYMDSTAVWRNARQSVQTYIDTSQSVALGATLHFNTKQYSTWRYWFTHGITGRVYGYRVRTLSCDTTLFERLTLWSASLSERIEQIGTEPESVALMQALTLGDKSGIDRELRSDYNRTGTAHMLAVSGLHVGIIFMVLSYLLGWIKLFPRGLVIYCCVVVCLLWGYAAITGFSPSVMRAVLMFTLYQGGVMLSRSSNNLNTLLAAGLILLVLNPNYLYDIGFQLSFVAMFGIVLYYRPIAGLWDSWVWRLVAVTLAAQIAVLPLSCYYFGNIPLVGVFANLALWLVVPTIIILTFCYLATGVEAVGSVAAWVAKLQNQMVEWGAERSWIAVENISMPLWVCLVIYGTLLVGTLIGYRLYSRS